ncbi:MAG: nucleotide exchange factor GrpE [Acidimicrobiales bacterium]
MTGAPGDPKRSAAERGSEEGESREIPESFSSARPGDENVPDGANAEPAELPELTLDSVLDWGTDPAKAAEGLEAQVDEAILAAERDEYLEALQRLQADFDNFRKRSARQQDELSTRATEGLCVRLLPVLDALDLAIEHVRSQATPTDEGKALEQIDSLLRDILAREGIERIDSTGVPFDPTVHDAVGHVAEDSAQDLEAASPTASRAGTTKAPKSGKANKALKAGAEGGPTVVQVMRAGYLLRSKVLRPAMVVVKG